ncbi:hypothetical protein BV372_17140 [Nostoc sp. T09]|uniref:hypothetical protein n=1 Tax=Nostoc sp. T09 TaxID=1932621 RepID=UPI000A389427|nr:hypothetical protein [Nostoc sp. T09]OUL33215.1 hypothetical protein BV372_17140 [Nostoc sp. T09]
MSQPSIEGFIQLITLYRPNFPGEIQGASSAQVDAFAELVYQVSALTLPSDYRDFLLKMGIAAPGFVADTSQPGWGERVPWSAFVKDASPNLESLHEYYSYLLEDGESPPPQCLVVGVFGVHCEEVFLECQQGIAGRVFSEKSNSRAIWADSWIGHLYKQGFRYIISKHMEIKAQNAITQEAASQLANLAIAYGLEVLWFSDAFDFCAASSDWEVLLYISDYTISPFFYLVGKKQSWSWISGDRTNSKAADFLQFLKRSSMN